MPSYKIPKGFIAFTLMQQNFNNQALDLLTSLREKLAFLKKEGDPYKDAINWVRQTIVLNYRAPSVIFSNKFSSYGSRFMVRKNKINRAQLLEMLVEIEKEEPWLAPFQLERSLNNFDDASFRALVDELSGIFMLFNMNSFIDPIGMENITSFAQDFQKKLMSQGLTEKFRASPVEMTPLIVEGLMNSKGLIKSLEDMIITIASSQIVPENSVEELHQEDLEAFYQTKKEIEEEKEKFC
jgi:hypothetical protein